MSKLRIALIPNVTLDHKHLQISNVQNLSALFPEYLFTSKFSPVFNQCCSLYIGISKFRILGNDFGENYHFNVARGSIDGYSQPYFP